MILCSALRAVSQALAKAARVGEDGGGGVVRVLVERAAQRRERAAADGATQPRVRRALRWSEADWLVQLHRLRRRSGGEDGLGGGVRNGWGVQEGSRRRRGHQPVRGERLEQPEIGMKVIKLRRCSRTGDRCAHRSNVSRRGEGVGGGRLHEEERRAPEGLGGAPPRARRPSRLMPRH